MKPVEVFPNIKAMGLKVYERSKKFPEILTANMDPFIPADPYFSAVSADDLEKALSEAPEVFKHPGQAFKQDWCTLDQATKTGAIQSARLVCIQEIPKESEKREITREDIQRAWKACGFCVGADLLVKELGL